MDSTTITPDFLRDPIGADCLVEALHKSSSYTLTVAGLDLDGSCEIVVDTQQPRLAFHLLAKRHGQIIFTAEHCSITLEAPSNNAAEDNKVAIRIEVVPSKEPIMPSSNRDGPRAPQHNRMERRSLSPRGHPTAVRLRSRSPMQQDSKGKGKPLVGKSRAELLQSIQAQKAVAESLEGLAREARHK